jgi:hypothetical protein
VKLYANENHTATLSLEDVPAAQGAAARARINAIARAAKSAGAGGELALPEAMTAIGLLLGTLPLIGPPVPPGDSPRDPGDAGPDGGPGEDTCTGQGPVTGPAAGPMPWPPIPGTSAAAAPGCAPVPAGLLKQGRIRLLLPWRDTGRDGRRARRTVLLRAGHPRPGATPARRKRPAWPARSPSPSPRRWPRA